MGQFFIYLFAGSLILSFIPPFKIINGTPAVYQALGFFVVVLGGKCSSQWVLLCFLPLHSFAVSQTFNMIMWESPRW